MGVSCMIRCCLIVEDAISVFLFKDSYIIAIENFDYGQESLNTIFNYLKQYNVSKLEVIMTSYVSAEIYREVVIVQRFKLGNREYYEYVAEPDVCKIKQLACTARVPEVNFYGSISYALSIVQNGIIVDQSDGMFSVIAVMEGRCVALSCCREVNLNSVLLGAVQKWSLTTLIDVKSFIDPTKLEYFSNYTMITELSMLPFLTTCSYVLTGCVPAINCTNTNKTVENNINGFVESEKAKSSQVNLVSAGVNTGVSMESQRNLKQHSINTKGEKVPWFGNFVLIMITTIIVISFGIFFGISKKLDTVNERLKKDIAEQDSLLSEIEAESEKLSVVNYDSSLLNDILSIKVNGCIGYVYTKSDEIEILFYLRSKKALSSLKEQLADYEIISIEDNGVLTVEDTECPKYIVRIGGKTL